jgi:hypothetical protein
VENSGYVVFNQALMECFGNFNTPIGSEAN